MCLKWQDPRAGSLTRTGCQQSDAPLVFYWVINDGIGWYWEEEENNTRRQRCEEQPNGTKTQLVRVSGPSERIPWTAEHKGKGTHR